MSYEPKVRKILNALEFANKIICAVFAWNRVFGNKQSSQQKDDSAPNIKYLISDIYSKKPIKFFLQLNILSRKNYDTRMYGVCGRVFLRLNRCDFIKNL